MKTTTPWGLRGLEGTLRRSLASDAFRCPIQTLRRDRQCGSGSRSCRLWHPLGMLLPCHALTALSPTFLTMSSSRGGVPSAVLRRTAPAALDVPSSTAATHVGSARTVGAATTTPARWPRPPSRSRASSCPTTAGTLGEARAISCLVTRIDASDDRRSAACSASPRANCPDARTICSSSRVRPPAARALALCDLPSTGASPSRRRLRSLHGIVPSG